MLRIKLAALITLTALCIGLLAGCGNNINGAYVYDDGDSYNIGNAVLTGEIRTLDVSWYSGDVKIEYHDGNTVEITESSDKELSEDVMLRYKVVGQKLTVKFVRSGVRLISSLNKTLTIKLPKGNAYSTVTVDTISADIDIGNITAAEARIKSISGRIDIEKMSVIGVVNLNSVSGDIHSSFTGSLDSLIINTVSGDVWTIADKLEEFKIETVSGEISIDCASAPKQGNMKSVSGDLILSMTVEGGFTMDMKTTSGKLESEYKVDKTDSGSYIHGNGEKKYKAETVSGDIFIKEH